jgi:hypothetical protein
MKLNINSNTAQLYRWFYSTSVMPESLCPYFWKLALMWVFIIPYVILSLPIILMELTNTSDENSTGERAGFGFLIWLLLGMIICMLSYVGLIWVIPTKDSFFMFVLTIGSIGWAVGIIVGGIELFKVLIEKWENRGIKYDEDGYRIWNPEPKQDSIIVSFAKASYNKYCPKIDWNHNK